MVEFQAKSGLLEIFPLGLGHGMAMSLQILLHRMLGAWLAVLQTQQNDSMKSSGLFNPHS